MDEKQYLTVQEVAQLLKLSTLTIYKYIKEKKLDVLDFGGHYRIERSALSSFINTHRISTSSRTEDQV